MLTSSHAFFLQVFQQWRLTPTLKSNNPLLTTLFKEDIMPCMTFSNQDVRHCDVTSCRAYELKWGFNMSCWCLQLAKSVLQSVVNNTLTIEPVPERDMYRCVQWRQLSADWGVSPPLDVSSSVWWIPHTHFVSSCLSSVLDCVWRWVKVPGKNDKQYILTRISVAHNPILWRHSKKTIQLHVLYCCCGWAVRIIRPLQCLSACAVPLDRINCGDLH